MSLPTDEHGRLRWLNEFLDTRPDDLGTSQSVAETIKLLSEIRKELADEERLVREIRALLREFPTTPEEKGRHEKVVWTKLAGIYACWMTVEIRRNDRLPRKRTSTAVRRFDM